MKYYYPFIITLVAYIMCYALHKKEVIGLKLGSTFQNSKR